MYTGTVRYSRHICCLIFAGALAAACGPDNSRLPNEPPQGTSNTGEQPPGEQPCAAPDGVSNAPDSIVSMVALMEALPQPVTVPCFVQALPRPMSIVASSSTFSAQPAAEGSPRVFAILDKFVVSWVPGGPGSEVLEFSEERPDGMSIKAELKMPVQGPITYEHFSHINQPERSGTACRGCHQNETLADDIGLGGEFFMSEALRVATRERVSVDAMRDLHLYCDRELNAERCDIFAAMFDHGEVVEGEFLRSLPTIYD